MTDHQIGGMAPLAQFLDGQCRQAMPARAASGQRDRDGVIGVPDQGQGVAWMA
jgi:hypothetical protein